MTELAVLAEDEITTSRVIAQGLGKLHKNVLRDIHRLKCSSDFILENFELSDYKDSTGRKLPQYLITKSGFMMLVFAYRGKKAGSIKEKYITTFSRMREYIENQSVRNTEDQITRDTVMALALKIAKEAIEQANQQKLT
jgi:Rha family phage regulatory protein